MPPSPRYTTEIENKYQQTNKLTSLFIFLSISDCCVRQKSIQLVGHKEGFKFNDKSHKKTLNISNIEFIFSITHTEGFFILIHSNSCKLRNQLGYLMPIKPGFCITGPKMKILPVFALQQLFDLLTAYKPLNPDCTTLLIESENEMFHYMATPNTRLLLKC